MSNHGFGANNLPPRYAKNAFCGLRTKNQIVHGGELELPTKMMVRTEPPLFIFNFLIVIWYTFYIKNPFSCLTNEILKLNELEGHFTTRDY